MFDLELEGLTPVEGFGGVKKPDFYNNLTLIQKALYDEMEEQFNSIVEGIDRATNIKQIPKRKRELNQSAIARFASAKLCRSDKPINPSSMSEKNCKPLFIAFHEFNDKLIAKFESSNAFLKGTRTTNKVQLTKDNQKLKKKIANISNIEYIERTCEVLNWVQANQSANLYEMIAQKEQQILELTKQNIALSKDNNYKIKSIANNIDTQKENKNLKQENIRLRTLLAKHGIQIE